MNRQEWTPPKKAPQQMPTPSSSFATRMTLIRGSPTIRLYRLLVLESGMVTTRRTPASISSAWISSAVEAAWGATGVGCVVSAVCMAFAPSSVDLLQAQIALGPPQRPEVGDVSDGDFLRDTMLGALRANDVLDRGDHDLPVLAVGAQHRLVGAVSQILAHAEIARDPLGNLGFVVAYVGHGP